MMRWASLATLLSTALAVVALLLGSARAEPPAATTEQAEKLGYGIGYQVGSDFRRSGRPLDPDALQAGVRDALSATTPRWTAAEMREALRRIEEANANEAVPDKTSEPAESEN